MHASSSSRFSITAPSVTPNSGRVSPVTAKPLPLKEPVKGLYPLPAGAVSAEKSRSAVST